VYNYVRQVDYCSGALLATKRSLFLELGGFDTYFQPAYYEDADYCFKLRDKGYRVYYQPESTVIHLEGATSGTDLSRGIKRYQAVNRAKFARRWGEDLKRQPNPPKRFDLATWHALAVRDRWEGAEEQ
jgi:O-antigen biosynthesis protein